MDGRETGTDKFSSLEKYGYLIKKDCFLHKTYVWEIIRTALGNTVIPVSARFKELAQHPPHKMFDT